MEEVEPDQVPRSFVKRQIWDAAVEQRGETIWKLLDGSMNCLILHVCTCFLAIKQQRPLGGDEHVIMVTHALQADTSCKA